MQTGMDEAPTSCGGHGALNDDLGKQVKIRSALKEEL
jgi:hypothetical protein